MSVATEGQITAEHLLALRGDLGRYSAGVLKIRTKQGTLDPLELNTAQRIVDAVVERQRAETGRVRVMLLKARQTGMCLDPSTRVLTTDLRWVRIEDLKPGTELVGTDEFPPGGKGPHRRLRRAVCEAKVELRAEAFRLVMSDGRELIATAEHRFLTKRFPSADETAWRTVGQLRPGHVLRHVTEPWADPSYEDGWFGGFADGEGGKELPAKRIGGRAWVQIARIEPLGPRRMVDLQTSTRTFIAEGFVSHNSTYTAARIYRGATLWGHRQGLVLADKRERAGDIFTIYERFNEHAMLKPPRKTTIKAQELAWSTDSRIKVDTAGDAQVARGTTIQFLHASELAFWPSAEEAWTSLAQAVPHDGGEIYVESTANGVGGLFYTMWLQAEAGETSWVPIFLPWWIHEEYRSSIEGEERADIVRSADPFERMAQDTGFALTGALQTAQEARILDLPLVEGTYRLSPEQLAWRRRKIRDDFLGDERTFRQEYPATAEEAFLVSGNAFFDEEACLEYNRRAKKPLLRGNLLRVGGGVVFRPAEQGYLKVWELPRPDGHYVIGADTASGRMGKGVQSKVLSAAQRERGGRDYSVAEVLETTTGRQVAEYHGYIAPDVFAEGCQLLGYYYGCGKPRRPALLAPENNHESGQTVIKWLLDQHYPRLYIHTRYNRRRERPSEMMGWITDRSTRMPMLDDFAAMVRAYEITLPSADLVREMITFVRGEEGRPEAQEGAHDDRVVALAIAIQMMEHHGHGAIGTVPEVQIADTPTGWG